MIKLIWNILKDERGWIPAAAIMGGSTILGSVLDKKKTTTQEPFPGYFGLAGDVSGAISKGMKQPGTAYPGTFDIPQPGVETAVESQILKSLAAPPTVSGYSKEISDKYKLSQIKSLKEEYGEQEKIEREMYNRLGLTSSTPWMERAGKLGEKKLSGIQEIEAKFDYEDIAREIEANKLVQDIMNQVTTQGQVLGQAQRGYAQYPVERGYQDWLRAYQEPQAWARMGAGLVGRAQPTTTTEPNIWSQLGQMGTDIGGMMMMGNILNPKKLSGNVPSNLGAKAYPPVSPSLYS